MKPLKSISLDARRTSFEVSRAAEMDFLRALRKIARISGNLVENYVENATVNSLALQAASSSYAKSLIPYATRQAMELTGRINRKNLKAWESQAKKIGTSLRLDLSTSLVGQTAQKLIEEQVGLITSIPLEAAERAQKLSQEAITGGKRPDEVARELMRTTEVTESRATLIARTESARASASLNEARALSVGSKAYIWRTAGDGDVRESHAEMDGEIVQWDNPPTLNDGMTGHAGTFPNCRCYAEPILVE
jgi:SPP1 gp7 family putative phage head morphogenesis protein